MRPLRTRPVVGLNGDNVTKIYPNGEVVVYRQKINSNNPFLRHLRLKPKPIPFEVVRLFLVFKRTFISTWFEPWWVVALFMGLSLVRNFDILKNPFLGASESERRELVIIADAVGYDISDKFRPGPITPRRYGRKGITRNGARKVRCAAYLLQKMHGRHRLSFATVTVPNIPIDEMRAVHENWGQVVERYRLGVRRELQAKSLPGEIISVSEVQEKRYKKSGLPVLHIHSVFVCRLPYGGWAVSTKRHDKLWRNALKSVIPKARFPVKAACNIKEVESSAEGYLGKYMTKGASVVNRMIQDGFAGWLPRQWWNMSRSLSKRIDSETIVSGNLSEVLLQAARANDKSVWEFWGDVSIDIGERQNYWLATYGRVTDDFLRLAREVAGRPPDVGRWYA